ncbi:MAG: aminotransferase class IV [Verrucomicrobia bacterium]|nr:aminotransferase class IV [Verrucomicrobiota bacterium]
MIVFLNGAFVPEEEATISVFDRAFLYGDGLFETLRLYQGEPFRWDQHLSRLRSGAEFLKIRLPFSPDELRLRLHELIRRNNATESAVRIVLSRGSGPRGYSPKGADCPVLIMSLHPAPQISAERPPQWRLLTASLRLLADDPLARFKTCNKLRHVLARSEADQGGANEALLLNASGEVATAASANVFWISEGKVWTAPLAGGALPGVTRSVIFEVCQASGLPCQEQRIGPEVLFKTEGVFLTLSTLGVVEATSLDGRPLARSTLTSRIHQAYQALIARETACRERASAST